MADDIEQVRQEALANLRELNRRNAEMLADWPKHKPVRNIQAILAATRLALDFTQPKPPQKIEQSGDGGRIDVNVTFAEEKQRLEEGIARISARL